MSSKVQRLVSQARATFSKQRADPAFSEELRRLKEEVKTPACIYTYTWDISAVVFVPNPEL